jgi:hypothetical protein
LTLLGLPEMPDGTRKEGSEVLISDTLTRQHPVVRLKSDRKCDCWWFLHPISEI